VPPPGNNIQNIDPTVLVDDDGRTYIYWGTFNQLRGAELATDMVTIKGSIVTVNTLTGYFEAPWFMKRKGTYYMLYAGNNAASGSPCTPTSYHACIAYGTSSSPLGPWTYRGIVLDVVSSTTSHSGVFQFNGDWFFVYHTRDATGGTHFRRSIAFDKLEWDDTVSPPGIRKVLPTRRPMASLEPTRNIALKATSSSSNMTPIQYWLASLNDGWIPASPLPPDYWCSWNDNRSPQTNTLIYKWNETVQLNGTSMAFFADHAAGSNQGVPPPASWRVEYLAQNGSWIPVKITTAGGYPTTVTDKPSEVGFETVSTSSIRAILMASGSGGVYGGVGIKEWMAFSPFPS
jgi:hypothetical protein